MGRFDSLTNLRDLRNELKKERNIFKEKEALLNLLIINMTGKSEFELFEMGKLQQQR